MHMMTWSVLVTITPEVLHTPYPRSIILFEHNLFVLMKSLHVICYNLFHHIHVKSWFILSTIITWHVSSLYGPIMAWSSKAGPRRVRQSLQATRVRDGMRRGNKQLVPRCAECHRPSRTMFKSRPVYGLGVFSKKRQWALGDGRTTPGTPQTNR
jgi:hypothetical protein